jgi:hypothetical protein
MGGGNAIVKVSSGVMFDDHKNKSSAKEEVTGLHEITCPGVRGMIAKKNCPSL